MAACTEAFFSGTPWKESIRLLKTETSTCVTRGPEVSSRNRHVSSSPAEGSRRRPGHGGEARKRKEQIKEADQIEIKGGFDA